MPIPTHFTNPQDFLSSYHVAAIRNGDLLLINGLVLPTNLSPNSVNVGVAEDFELFAIVTGNLVDVLKDRLGFTGRLTRDQFVNRLLNVYDIAPENFEEFAV